MWNHRVRSSILQTPTWTRSDSWCVQQFCFCGFYLDTAYSRIIVQQSPSTNRTRDGFNAVNYVGGQDSFGYVHSWFSAVRCAHIQLVLAFTNLCFQIRHLHLSSRPTIAHPSPRHCGDLSQHVPPTSINMLRHPTASCFGLDVFCHKSRSRHRLLNHLNDAHFAEPSCQGVGDSSIRGHRNLPSLHPSSFHPSILPFHSSVAPFYP